MPTTMPKSPKPGNDEQVGGTCNFCQKTRIKLGEYDLSGMSAGEVWDQTTAEFIKRGWRVNRRDNGARELMCPACQEEMEKRQTMELPNFDPLQVCPKCTSHEVKSAFCTGRAPDCSFGAIREHMHRACGSCGFTWLTRCADQNHVSWWKRLLRRFHGL
jgi:hypothetical protein